MVSPAALLNATAIAFRRLESGMSTTLSNSTVTPLPWRAGICVSMETALRGLPFTLTVSPLPKPALGTSADRSEIEFLSRYNLVSFVSPATAEISEILLRLRFSHVRLISPANDEMSEIEFPLRSSDVRLISPTNTEMSEIEFQLRFSNLRLVNPANAEKSEIKFPSRSSDVRLVNPATAEISDIELDVRSSDVRLIACSSPVKSLMLDFLASRTGQSCHI